MPYKSWTSVVPHEGYDRGSLALSKWQHTKAARCLRWMQWCKLSTRRHSCVTLTTIHDRSFKFGGFSSRLGGRVLKWQIWDPCFMWTVWTAGGTLPMRLRTRRMVDSPSNKAFGAALERANTLPQFQCAVPQTHYSHFGARNYLYICK